VPLSRLGLVISVVCLSAGLARANDFSFTGTFVQDDQLQLFLFTAPSANTIVRTWGYAGGTNANGQVIPAGGFDPLLSVFDATGGLVGSSSLIALNDAGTPCPDQAPNCASADPVTGSAWDALLVLDTLNPGGTYALILSQTNNDPNQITGTFGDGLSHSGVGNFTAAEFHCCGTTPFWDGNCDQRTGNWAVDISGVGAAINAGAIITPEPGSLLVFAAGITGLALRWRSRKQL
jgi:hypothetical protein